MARCLVHSPPSNREACFGSGACNARTRPTRGHPIHTAGKECTRVLFLQMLQPLVMLQGRALVGIDPTKYALRAHPSTLHNNPAPSLLKPGTDYLNEICTLQSKMEGVCLEEVMENSKISL